jgi:hypothetical protein
MTPQELSNSIYYIYKDDCESYSGRYMYGQKCLGIRCDNPIILFVELIKELINTITVKEVIVNDECFFHESIVNDFQVILDLLKDLKTDDIGMQTILYFPNLPPPEKY